MYLAATTMGEVSLVAGVETHRLLRGKRRGRCRGRRLIVSIASSEGCSDHANGRQRSQARHSQELPTFEGRGPRITCLLI
jgi:hypothetical protein